MLPTEHYVNKKDWTGSQVDKIHSSHKYINAKLSTLVSSITNYSLMNPSLSSQELKIWAKGENSVFTPVTYFQHYIKLCKFGVIVKKLTRESMSDGYCRALGTSSALLELYAKDHKVTWDGIGEEFYSDYVSFLRDKGYKQNYIAKAVKQFGIIAKHAKKKKVHSNEETSFSVQIEKVKKIRLTPEEVQAVIKVDIKAHLELKPEWERFQVAYNLLLRFGDSVAINEKNIIVKEGRPHLTAFTQKGRKEILLPIKQSVYAILKRNKFQLTAVNSTSNEKLKMLGMLAGIKDKVTVTEFRRGKKIETVYQKYQLIETHTTRRSAARNLYDSGMDPLIIMVLGGWKTLKQLLDYIDIDLEYAASKAVNHSFFD